ATDARLLGRRERARPDLLDAGDLGDRRGPRGGDQAQLDPRAVEGAEPCGELAGAVVPELERVAVGEPAARLVRQLGRRPRGGPGETRWPARPPGRAGAGGGAAPGAGGAPGRAAAARTGAGASPPGRASEAAATAPGTPRPPLRPALYRSWRHHIPGGHAF